MIKNIKYNWHIARSVVIVGLILIMLIAYPLITNKEASASTQRGSLYLTSSNSKASLGNLVTLTVFENSEQTPVNGVQVNLTYPSNILSFVSYNSNGLPFNYPGPTPATTQSSFNYAIFSTTPLTGNRAVVNVVFRVVGYGSANVSLANSIVSSSNGLNIGDTLNGTNITVAKPVIVPPIVVIKPTHPVHSVKSTQVPSITQESQPLPAPQAPARKAMPAPVIHIFTKPRVTSVSFTPQGSSQPVVVLPRNNIKLIVPIVVRPNIVQPTHQFRKVTPPDPIVKVEYFLNNKLVSVVTKSPYKYKLPTNNILNGNYNLTIKTYRAGGGSSSTPEHLIVANPFSLNQVRLASLHYKFQELLTLIVIVLLIVAFYMRSRVSSFLNKKLVSEPVVINAPRKDDDNVNRYEMQTPPSGPSLDQRLNNLPTPVQPPGSIYGPDNNEDVDHRN